MNYGFDPSPVDGKLAEALTEMIGKFPPDNRDRRAYVEINGLYSGVRIRRLTHYTEELREQLVDKAEVIYERLVTKK